MFQRPGMPKPRKGGTIGTQEEDRFQQISAGLFDSQGSQLAVIEGALGHHPFHGQIQLLLNLLQGQIRDRPASAPFFGQELVGIFNCLLAAFDCYVHNHLKF